ncbi:MAG: hypothetical protein K8T90_16025 [Planctomycetes bacterium]|nr:hypothetical protein [Planctomycetota bacterium]
MKTTRPPMSRAAAFAGATTLIAVLVGTEALVVSMRGISPATVIAATIGIFLGLISLAVEIGLLERSARTFHAQGVQTTFISFVMRLATVAPVTLLMMKTSLGLDPQAFALSYCGTFFLYLCWLTVETYHAPVHYRPKTVTTAAGQVQEVIVRENRRKTGSIR